MLENEVSCVQEKSPQPLSFQFANKKKRTRAQCLCSDIDQTLFSSERNIRMEHKSLLHLAAVTIKIRGENRSYYAINHSIMGKIFAAMLAKGVQIAFITNSDYDKEDLFAVLEILYQLPKGILDNCVYINRNHKHGGRKKLKGSIVVDAQVDDILPADAEITLLEDTDVHIADAIAKGFDTIKAEGCPLIGEVNNDYLQELIDKFELPVNIELTDPAVRKMKKFSPNFG